MPAKARLYIWSVMTLALIAVLVSAVTYTTPSEPPVKFMLGVGIAAVAGAVKLRLPGLEGTYSLAFLPVLVGVLNLPWPETLLLGCVAALAQSYLNSRKRPASVQAVFNVANIVLSITAAYAVSAALSHLGIGSSLPAAVCLIATTYFFANTQIVSGVLALVEGKPLRAVADRWYFWSAPYFCIGLVVVAIANPGLHGFRWESALVMGCLLGLLHFYTGLQGRKQEVSTGDGGAGIRGGTAWSYFGAVLIAAAAAVTVGGAAGTTVFKPAFLVYLLLTIVASMLKVRLPGLQQTISLNFVLLLVAILQLSHPEVVLLAGVAAVVQCLWRPGQKPVFVQVLFSVAALIVSVSAARAAVHALPPPVPMVGVVAVAATVLYFANTLTVAAMIGLVEGHPMHSIWTRCHFWSFNYYLVGAAGAGVLLASIRQGPLSAAPLVVPTLALIWLSYRLHVNGVGTQIASAPVNG